MGAYNPVFFARLDPSRRCGTMHARNPNHPRRPPDATSRKAANRGARTSLRKTVLLIPARQIIMGLSAEKQKERRQRKLQADAEKIALLARLSPQRCSLAVCLPSVVRAVWETSEEIEGVDAARSDGEGTGDGSSAATRSPSTMRRRGASSRVEGAAADVAHQRRVCRKPHKRRALPLQAHEVRTPARSLAHSPLVART